MTTAPAVAAPSTMKAWSFRLLFSRPVFWILLGSATRIYQIPTMFLLHRKINRVVKSPLATLAALNTYYTTMLAMVRQTALNSIGSQSGNDLVDLEWVCDHLVFHCFSYPGVRAATDAGFGDWLRFRHDLLAEVHELVAEELAI